MLYYLELIFWNETLHVSDSSSDRHQEFFTVHTVQFLMQNVTSYTKTN